MKTSRSIMPILCAISAASLFAGDLSRYREYQLGTDLVTVAKQAHMDPAAAKMLQQRPALLQELTWRPQTFGPSDEPVRSVVFSFYNGELFQIAVTYDPYHTEGMTNTDLVEALSENYGKAAVPEAPVKRPGLDGDTEETVASWEKDENSVRLVRRSYSQEFAVIAVHEKLAALAESSILIARRLDAQEAPEREAARAHAEVDAARAKREQARARNKPNFRP